MRRLSEPVRSQQRDAKVGEEARRHGETQDQVEHGGRSHPPGGANGQGEGGKAGKAEGEIDQVQHGATPRVVARKPGAIRRKAAIRKASLPRKGRVNPAVSCTGMVSVACTAHRIRGSAATGEMATGAPTCVPAWPRHPSVRKPGQAAAGPGMLNRPGAVRPRPGRRRSRPPRAGPSRPPATPGRLRPMQGRACRPPRR